MNKRQEIQNRITEKILKERDLIVDVSIRVGKCLGKGTKVLMSTGEFKNVENILPGELVMGPDSIPKKVISIVTGKDDMYRINQYKGDPYVVNSEHILSLKYTDTTRKISDLLTIYNKTGTNIYNILQLLL